MKRTTILPSLTALLFLTTPLLNAATYFWDPAGTPLTPSGGTGTWDTSSTRWSDGTNDIAWPNGIDTASFGGAAGTVTISGTVNANSLSFGVTGYNVTVAF